MEESDKGWLNLMNRKGVSGIMFLLVPVHLCVCVYAESYGQLVDMTYFMWSLLFRVFVLVGSRDLSVLK